MLTVLWTKILILVALFACTFGLSLLPLKLLSAARSADGDSARRRRYERCLSLLNCYAAGVFLSTCMLALFPHVKTELDAGLNALNISTPFPLAEFIVLFGLFMILFVEQLVISSSSHGHGHGGRHSDDRDGSYKPLLTEPEQSHDSSQTVEYSRGNKTIPDQNHGDETIANSRGHSHIQNLNGEVERYDEDSDSDDGTGHTYHNQHHHHHNHHHHEHKVDEPQSFLRAMVLLFALSLHSLFEGLALGLQKDTSIVLQIFAALILHKSILAFSVGVNLVQSGIKTATIVKSNFLFAVTSPVGIAIGILIIDLTRNNVASILVNAVLQGLASGTFLFVVFFEILPHEFSHESKLTENRGERLLKLLLLILGYSTICVLIMFLPDEIRSKPVHS